MSDNKYYELATHNEAQFDELFLEITGTASSPATVPDRAVENTEYFQHSPVRGEFLLTDAEAETLKTDVRIKYIQLSPDKYPDIFNATDDDLRMDGKGKNYLRYNDPFISGPTHVAGASGPKHYQFWANNGAISSAFNAGSNAQEMSHASNQLYRMSQQRNPWISSGTSSSTAINNNITQFGAGEDVDVICADNGTWIGHVEFNHDNVGPGEISPGDMIPYITADNIGVTQVVPGVGRCDVFDVILDGPYYIDREWFDSDPDNRLTQRFDGYNVPVESVARAWWGNSAQRSAAFSSIGTVTISSLYTRDRVHGSNSANPSGASATHGTQCASLIYGRTHGWAYNCNKWHLNLYGGSNAGTIERGFDIVKLFHENKPVNPIFGTKNPTVMSNSWGYRANKSGSYYYFRNSGATSYPGSSDEPEFLKYMGVDGDLGRWSSEFPDNSLTQAGEELVNAGVIFIAAAGNSGQQVVNPDHPNYDNRIANNNTNGLYDLSNTFNSFGYNVYGTTNRRGFPNHIGKTESQSFQGDTVDFPAISVGALDDALVTHDGNIKERKVNYSNMGNAIDIYAPADGTLAATVGTYGTDVSRPDGPTDSDYAYPGQFLESRDTRFSGTSAACPVAAGFLASVMQYNRGWTYSQLRNWINNNVASVNGDEFYVGTEDTTAESSGWSDRTKVQDTQANTRVLYSAVIPVSTPNPSASPTVGVGGQIKLKNGLILKRKP